MPCSTSLDAPPGEHSIPVTSRDSEGNEERAGRLSTRTPHLQEREGRVLQVWSCVGETNIGMAMKVQFS